MTAPSNSKYTNLPMKAYKERRDKSSLDINFVLVVGVTHWRSSKNLVIVNFKCWQQKLFYLTILNLTKFLIEEAPILYEEETDKEKELAFDAWKHAKYLCRNYILNDLGNTL